MEVITYLKNERPRGQVAQTQSANSNGRRDHIVDRSAERRLNDEERGVRSRMGRRKEERHTIGIVREGLKV